jgi:beta-mannosidase
MVGVFFDDADLQYAQLGHSPTNDTTEELELRHQMRRLSHHPSIVIWDGCNECQVVIGTPTGIYATFVLAVVAQEDASRVIWPSCPSSGWIAGVNRLTSLPNNSTLGLLPRVTTNAPIEVSNSRGKEFIADH